jgi:putative addiction module component (TIGR02574 family)
LVCKIIESAIPFPDGFYKRGPELFTDEKHAMIKTFEVIAHEVLELPRPQQIRLAHYLLSLDDEPADPEIEAAWEKEIVARMEAFREGRTQGIPFEEVQSRLDACLRECR